MRYLLTALRTGRASDPCKQKSEIIVYLSHGPDSRTRIVRRSLLIYRYGGRQSFDIIDVRLVHLSEKLSRIRRKRLDVASLPFRKYRIERERRFSRAAESCEHDQFFSRDPYVDIFKIVYSCSFYENILSHFFFPLISFFNSAILSLIFMALSKSRTLAA